MARYYDSRTGTFCSADPLAGDPSDPQSWNRYPYGRNDPISVTDPSGKSWWSSLLIDIGVGVAMYFAGPEIASFFGGPSAGSLGYAAGDLPQTLTHVPALVARTAATAAPAIGGDAAAAGGSFFSLGAGLAGAAGAQAAQSTDQPKTPTAASGCAQTPGGTPSKYCVPLQQGLDAAKKALQKKRCNKFYGGQGAQTLNATTYWFLDMNNPTTGAATIDPGNVFVNSNGPYMNYTPTAGQAGPFGRYWTQSQFRGFILLHELGHQLSPITGFGPDAGSPLNQVQSGRVLSNCF